MTFSNVIKTQIKPIYNDNVLLSIDLQALHVQLNSKERKLIIFRHTFD